MEMIGFEVDSEPIYEAARRELTQHATPTKIATPHHIDTIWMEERFKHHVVMHAHRGRRGRKVRTLRTHRGFILQATFGGDLEPVQLNVFGPKYARVSDWMRLLREDKAWSLELQMCQATSLAPPVPIEMRRKPSYKTRRREDEDYTDRLTEIPPKADSKWWRSCRITRSPLSCTKVLIHLTLIGMIAVSVISNSGAQSKSRAAQKFGSGASFRDCANCPEMVVVAAGTFTMGSPASERGHQGSESPQHQVTIAKPIAVSKLPVTFANGMPASMAAAAMVIAPMIRGGAAKIAPLSISGGMTPKPTLPGYRQRRDCTTGCCPRPSENM